VKDSVNIRKRNNSWQVDGSRGGVRFRKQFRSAVDAESFAASGGIPAEVSDHTIGELYLRVYQARWVALKTVAQAALGNQIVAWFGEDYPVKSIDARKVHSMVADLKSRGKANGTVNRWRAGLNVMLAHAVDLGWLDKKPEVKALREPEGRNRYLTKEEEQEIFALVRMKDARLESLMVLLIDTGLRLSEALSLRWRDVNTVQVSVHDTKNGESRTVPLTSRAWQAINSFSREEAPFAWTNRYRSSAVFTWAREQSSVAGDKDVVVHTLRHTCASRMIQRGAPVAVVSRWLGHKSLAMTMRYSHLRPDQLHEWVHVLEDAG
jgi:integrase